MRACGVSEYKLVKDSQIRTRSGSDVARSFWVVPEQLWRADVVLTSRPAGIPGNVVDSSPPEGRSSRR